MLAYAHSRMRSLVTPATMYCGSATLYGADALEQNALLSAVALIFHTLKLFYFPIIIGLVQRIVRFVMHTEPKASCRMVQYEYPYRYTPNIYTSHRSEYTPHIFVNIWLYLLMWQHWRSDTLLQCKVVHSVHFCEILCKYNMSQYSYLCC